MTDSTHAFNLDSFFPYKVRVLYRAVSDRISRVYNSTYGLSVQEWRIMAVLGPTDGMTATQIVRRSSMDKVVISRAIRRLKDRGFIAQRPHPTDGRQLTLSLNDIGQSVFHEVVPKVLAAERELLSDLTSDEQKQLLELMQKVQLAAEV